MAEALHVPVRYIDAIESDDFAALPPSVYARALIRSYARLVGVNPAEVSEHAVPQRPQDRNPIRPAVEPLEKPPLVSWRAIWTAGLLVAALCLLVYLYSQYNSFARSVESGGSLIVESLPTPSSRNLNSLLTPFPTTTPDPTPTQEIAPTPIQGLIVEARVSERSWLQVWTDGRSVLAEPVPAGTARSFTADRAIRMRVGNAGAVDVTVNGLQQGRLGAPGQVLDVSWGRES
jgi:cytoskeletal protein RodZ